MIGGVCACVHVGVRYDFNGPRLQIGCKRCKRLYSKVPNKKNCCDTKCQAQSSMSSFAVPSGRFAHSVTQRVLPAGAVGAALSPPAAAVNSNGGPAGAAGKQSTSAPKPSAATSGGDPAASLLQKTWADLYAQKDGNGERAYVSIIFEQQKVYYEFPQVPPPSSPMFVNVCD